MGSSIFWRPSHELRRTPGKLMKQAEKQRLAKLTRGAIERMSDRSQIRVRAKKIGCKYSPTNADNYRELSEIVWWLIAANSYSDAMRLLDALCEVDDDLYWMFHALASSFATRAWLHARLKNRTASLSDAQAALRWIHRDPNPRPITKAEVSNSIKRFDEWLERADGENGSVTAAKVLSHALRVLVIYQQLAKGGDAAAKSVPSRDFNFRLNSAIKKLRTRIDNLST